MDAAQFINGAPARRQPPVDPAASDRHSIRDATGAVFRCPLPLADFKQSKYRIPYVFDSAARRLRVVESSHESFRRRGLAGDTCLYRAGVRSVRKTAGTIQYSGLWASAIR